MLPILCIPPANRILSPVVMEVNFVENFSNAKQSRNTAADI